VGVDLPRPQALEDELLERAIGTERAEVHHHGHIGEPAGLYGSVDGGPFRASVVRRLDADDHAGELTDALGRQPGVHVPQVLLGRPPLHPVADDIEKGEDACRRAIDDLPLELVEVAPTGAAGIDHRGDAGAKGESVGGHAGDAGAQVGVRVSAVEHMAVQVQNSRRHVKIAGIHHLPGVGGRDVAGHPGNFAAADGDVQH